ncbi:WD40-repeat-containing domain protein [Lentinula aff. detonsa]|nr:WD40-repeat-containing domain protein [Lentinula aff. detonsa]
MFVVGSSSGSRLPNNSKKERRRQEALKKEQADLRSRKPNIDLDGYCESQPTHTTPHYSQSRMRRFPGNAHRDSSAYREYTSQSSNTPTRASTPIVIADDSDSDDIEILHVPLPPKKKQKISIPISITDENYIDLMSSPIRMDSTTSQMRRDMDRSQDILNIDTTDDEMDQERDIEDNGAEDEEEEMYNQTAPSLNDFRLWKPFVPKSMEQQEPELLPDLANLRINDQPRFSTKRDGIQYFTGRAQAVNVTTKSTKLHSFHLTTELLRRSRARSKRPFDYFHFQNPTSWLHRMRSPAPSTFKTSAGGKFGLDRVHISLIVLPAINKIVQYKDRTIVASSVVGGYPDEPEESENAYNQPGTLVAWKGLEHVVIKGHSRKHPFPKNYTVNDVAIYPTSQISDDNEEAADHIILSTGNDYKLQLWQQSEDGSYAQLPSPPRRGYKQAPGLQPIDITVKPGGGMFAVSGRQVILHSERPRRNGGHPSWDSVELSLIPQEGNIHRSGPMKWGCGPTGSLLFASSESCGDNSGVGYHKAFDVRRRTEYFKFDLSEDGDALAVDAFGEKAAFITVKRNDDDMIEDEDRTNAQRTLRIYDVRRMDGRRQAEVAHQVKLESSEVNCASFSPDGIYLAVGKLDGRTLVYDSRFMDELLYDFEHHGPSLVSPGNDSYGITHLEWRVLHQDRLALVTGGPDGCVRLWQPHWAPRITEQGRIVAQVNADVGYFTIGDRFQGEHELVVGDGDGAIYFFDGIGNI